MKVWHYHRNGAVKSFCGRAWAGPKTVTGQAEKVTCKWCLRAMAASGVVLSCLHPVHADVVRVTGCDIYEMACLGCERLWLVAAESHEGRGEFNVFCPGGECEDRYAARL